MQCENLQSIIDHKTKPLGALGRLEELALQAGSVFGTSSPAFHHPHLLVFAADHGIATAGVSAYPPEVTAQMVLNFLAGGAAINVFCRQHGITLKIIDAGVNYDFDAGLPLGAAKIAKGTASFLQGPAMSAAQLQACLTYGETAVSQAARTGCNVIGFGEMGIGNTSSAAVLMSLLCDIDLADCTGRGTGLDDRQLEHKYEILHTAVQWYQGGRDVHAVLAHFGGFEIAQLCGAMLAAAGRHMLVLVDGFIATAAWLCACRMNPGIAGHAVFCHESGEKGHSLLLRHLGAVPVLQLGLRLGEGTGCALAYPLLQSALLFVREMASFDTAAVDRRS